MTRIHLPIWLLMAGLTWAGLVLAASPASRIVYHIDFEEPARQATALRNIANQIEALEGQPFDLRVILHGRGVSLLLPPDSVLETSRLTYANAEHQALAQIRALRQQGVTFWVCRNTLTRYGLSQANLHPAGGAHLIPSGIAELARLQSQGYAYIKP